MIYSHLFGHSTEFHEPVNFRRISTMMNIKLFLLLCRIMVKNMSNSSQMIWICTANCFIATAFQMSVIIFLEDLPVWLIFWYRTVFEKSWLQENVHCWFKLTVKFSLARKIWCCCHASIFQLLFEWNLKVEYL